MNRSLVVLSTCILLLLSCVCSPKENSSGSNESKMTLLCWRETEQNVFRDGRPGLVSSVRSIGSRRRTGILAA